MVDSPDSGYIGCAGAIVTYPFTGPGREVEFVVLDDQ